uniref:Uncharacterized protein n=1 Tax=Anguilla anguilla TaxID=7936 RepID=A0A0E9UR16_ANGAN
MTCHNVVLVDALPYMSDLNLT